MTALPIRFQPQLVEEVAFRLIRGRRDERQFRRGRDRLYSLPEEDRDRAFAEFHADWFARLGLAKPVEAALAELPVLAEHCARCVVTGALSRQDEGADLLVASEEDGVAGRTVLIRLRPTTFEDFSRLATLLRAELLHVADMVDPAFGYQPSLPPADGGPSYERLLRERYRVLWNVRVTGRLVRRGVLGNEARAHACLAFAEAFPMLGSATEDTFSRFFDERARTHAELAAFAAAPRSPNPAAGLGVGGRCPLCRFPTYAPQLEPEGLPRAVLVAIGKDFPAWRVADGLCRQCADLYSAASRTPVLGCVTSG